VLLLLAIKEVAESKDVERLELKDLFHQNEIFMQKTGRNHPIGLTSETPTSQPNLGTLESHFSYFFGTWQAKFRSSCHRVATACVIPFAIWTPTSIL
jgi:hypothetical protein